MRGRSFTKVLALAMLLAPAAGCQDKSKTEVPADKDEGDDDGPAQSVFATGKSHPLAERLCEAVQSAPRIARAKCCQSKPGVLLTSECTRTLSASLADSAVTLGEPAVAACEKAIATMYAGCDWVGAKSRPLPEACLGLVTGARESGAGCRSSLECGTGEYCHGVSPTQLGKCGPPHAAGGACGRGADTLVSYLRDLKAQHPECEGFCANGKCRTFAPPNKKCLSNAHCGPGAHCGPDETCLDGERGEKDQPCLGGLCAPGLRCVDKVCRTPKAKGATCQADVECEGACLVDGQGPDGICGMRCQP